MNYGKVTEALVEELRGLLGPKNVICDAERMEAYSHDETSAEEYGHMPDVVVTPTSTDQVTAVVRLANRERIPVTPRGAGSGLSGGAIPSLGGISVSLEKMNKGKGLFYAGYPMSLETCFLGGNIAENAGGGKAVKYGVTSRYVLGLELVTPTGEVVWLGGKLSKDVTGYDLTHLIVGSEGTLGIVTTAIIRLIGLPKAKSDLLVLFRTPAEAIACVPEIIARGTIPVSMEFMDKLSVETSCGYLNESLPYEGCGAMLLIEMDGQDAATVDADAERVGDLCMEKGAIEVYMADNRTTQERVWSVRRNIAEAFKVRCPVQSLEDIVVPTASIPDIIPELDRIAAKYGIAIPCYGHAGDGNLHATLVKDPDMALEVWKKAEPEALEELYAAVTKLGGKISGEHGIGLKRKKYMAEFMSPVEMGLIKAIKMAWDPKGIMNPGKLFDLD
ncbi:FAD-binding protein [bacterium]|nr:FAD-binding protein [bacterium]